MERNKKAVVLLGLIEELRDNLSWCGETHIQKATYFLQEMMQVPLGFDFILYKHGPFSFDLADEITAMRADNFLKLQPQPYPYGPSILPGEASKSLMKRFPKTLQKFSSHTTFVAEKLGGKKVNELEKLATALYVTSGNKSSGDVQRAQRIHDLKPHVSIDEALEATKTVDQFTEDSRNIIAA
jgi:uncharacterized protein YwgA